jgi:uncharacterized RDD family membrane protein YckC
MTTDTNPETLPPAGLLRRLAAFVYDILLLAAILFIAAFVALLFSGGEAISPGNPWYQTYLFILSFIFYAWFWTRGGQTLGMRAWRLRVESMDGGPINLGQSLLRFMAGLVTVMTAGLAMLWMLVDKDKRTLHDRFSDTRVVVLPKVKK